MALSRATGWSAGQTSQAYMPQRKQVTVMEMLEYVKALDIDPIKEADMLWIAEEAFHAPLPPNWSEHQDEQGRVYFHNSSTGESQWRHPMDDLFREVVNYYRWVIKVGGFWTVEDEIADLEENIRRDLADWMELYDEHGEKFFYNRRTEESRFDDPRMSVYHNLYARIKMVAKMKEKLPALARAVRPSEPTVEELEARRRQQEEEDEYVKNLVRIQSMARVLVAKKKVERVKAQASMEKGPQPLRGRLRLRIEKIGPDARKELVLSETTPHRRHKAAARIQARVRGILARKRFRPLVLHRAFLARLVTKIQTRWRIVLAKRRVARMKVERRIRCAIKIQKCFRGYRDRQYVKGLQVENERFKKMLRAVVTIQSGMRMCLAKWRVQRIRKGKQPAIAQQEQEQPQALEQTIVPAQVTEHIAAVEEAPVQKKKLVRDDSILISEPDRDEEAEAEVPAEESGAAKLEEEMPQPVESSNVEAEPESIVAQALLDASQPSEAASDVLVALQAAAGEADSADLAILADAVAEDEAAEDVAVVGSSAEGPPAETVVEPPPPLETEEAGEAQQEPLPVSLVPDAVQADEVPTLKSNTAETKDAPAEEVLPAEDPAPTVITTEEAGVPVPVESSEKSEAVLEEAPAEPASSSAGQAEAEAGEPAVEEAVVELGVSTLEEQMAEPDLAVAEEAAPEAEVAAPEPEAEVAAEPAPISAESEVVASPDPVPEAAVVAPEEMETEAQPQQDEAIAAADVPEASEAYLPDPVDAPLEEPQPEAVATSEEHTAAAAEEIPQPAPAEAAPEAAVPDAIEESAPEEAVPLQMVEPAPEASIPPSEPAEEEAPEAAAEAVPQAEAMQESEPAAEAQDVADRFDAPAAEEPEEPECSNPEPSAGLPEPEDADVAESAVLQPTSEELPQAEVQEPAIDEPAAAASLVPDPVLADEVEVAAAPTDKAVEMEEELQAATIEAEREPESGVAEEAALLAADPAADAPEQDTLEELLRQHSGDADDSLDAILALEADLPPADAAETAVEQQEPQEDVAGAAKDAEDESSPMPVMQQEVTLLPELHDSREKLGVDSAALLAAEADADVTAEPQPPAVEEQVSPAEELAATLPLDEEVAAEPAEENVVSAPEPLAAEEEAAQEVEDVASESAPLQGEAVPEASPVEEQSALPLPAEEAAVAVDEPSAVIEEEIAPVFAEDEDVLETSIEPLDTSTEEAAAAAAGASGSQEAFAPSPQNLRSVSEPEAEVTAGSPNVSTPQPASYTELLLPQRKKKKASKRSKAEQQRSRSPPKEVKPPPQNDAHLFLMNAPRLYKDIVPTWGSPGAQPPPPVTASPPIAGATGHSHLKSAALRQTLSVPALTNQPSSETQAVTSTPQGEQESSLVSPSQAATRRTYGGIFTGAHFERSKAMRLEDLSDAEMQQVLDDMEKERTAKIERILKRQQFHKDRHRQQENQKTEKLRAQQLEFEQAEEEKRQKKVADLKVWLKRKEAEHAAKKQREDDAMTKVKMMEEQKVEKFRQAEQKRLEERGKRLQQAEQKKRAVEAQFASAPLKTALERPAKATSSMAMPELRKPTQPPRHQRVVHRHIHHHVHYHDGSDESENEPVFAVSREEQMRIEQASEAKVRAQLEAFPPASFQYGTKKSDLHTHHRLDQNLAATPPMHGLSPLRMKGAGPGSRSFPDLSRTEESSWQAWQRRQLPPAHLARA